jgi:DNA modification methylase
MMNEIFGEENFIVSLIWKRRQNVDSRSKNGASVDHEYILCFRKTESGLLRGAEKDLNKYSNPNNDPKGDWMSADMTGLATIDQRPNLHYDLEDPKTGIIYKCPPTGWRYEPKRMKELIKHDEIIFPQKPDGRPRRKKYLNDLESEFTGLSSILETVFNTQGTRELRAIFDDKEYFDFPKPVELIKILIEQGTVHHNDIILDFFSGSSTTAQAVLELNGQSNVSRKFLMVQLPEKCDENSEAFKAGFKTIADISKERIRRVIKKLEKEAEELKKKKADELPLNESGSNQPIAGRLFPIAGFKTFKLSPSTFKIWRGNDITEDNLITQLDAFTDPVREGSEKENMLYELILKSGYLLTDKVEVVSKYYSIKEGELKIVLNEINQKLVDAIISAKPKKVIMLDNLFTGYDQLKTNTVLQMKDAEIDFKTI